MLLLIMQRSLPPLAKRKSMPALLVSTTAPIAVETLAPLNTSA